MSAPVRGGYLSRLPSILFQVKLSYHYVPDTLGRVKKRLQADMGPFGSKMGPITKAILHAARENRLDLAQRIMRYYCVIPRELVKVAWELGDLAALQWLVEIEYDIGTHERVAAGYMHLDVLDWARVTWPSYISDCKHILASVSPVGRNWCLRNRYDGSFDEEWAISFALRSGSYDEEYILSCCPGGKFARKSVIEAIRCRLLGRGVQAWDECLPYWKQIMPRIAESVHDTDKETLIRKITRMIHEQYSSNGSCRPF